MDDHDLRRIDSWRPFAEAVAPNAQQRKMSAVHEAFSAGGEIKPEALALSLAPYLVTWYLSGAVTTGVNKEKEIELPTESRITSIRLRIKTAPAGTECTVILKGNGVEIGSASIEIGQTSGRSVGINAVVAAGTVLTYDVSTASGSNLTTTVTYVPISA